MHIIYAYGRFAYSGGSLVVPIAYYGATGPGI